MVDYLDPEIAGEGQSCNNWVPGAWTNAPAVSEDEYQPDIEPPHIPDYAMLKKHKHYRQYFRPYRYHPFPAFMYGPNGAEKIVKTREEVIALGPDWSPTPPAERQKKIDMTGKSLPVKSDTAPNGSAGCWSGAEAAHGDQWRDRSVADCRNRGGCHGGPAARRGPDAGEASRTGS